MFCRCVQPSDLVVSEVTNFSCSICCPIHGWVMNYYRNARLDYQPLFGKMSPHSSPRRSLSSGRIKDRTRETVEIEPTGMPSLVKSKSNSTPVAPFSFANLNAASVFSGASNPPPRWPIIIGECLVNVPRLRKLSTKCGVGRGNRNIR